MAEEARLRELYDYEILNTPPEKGLDDLVEIAAAICNTPITLISLLDEHKQWFKSKIGLDIQETSRQDAFCNYAIMQPKEVLVVEDALLDVRFKNNPYVVGNPHTRFYAGAPLETPSGQVIGTLCIIDSKPRKLSETQKKALHLLAKKAMDYLNTRKLIREQNKYMEKNAGMLLKLTNYIPDPIYQFEVSPEGKMSIPFISKGITDFHPSLTPEILKDNLDALFKVIHPEDLPGFQESIAQIISNPGNWLKEFRIISPCGKVQWLVGKSRVEKNTNGKVIWYGIIRDITKNKDYVTTLEQILFDISHVINRPVANLKGLVSVLEAKILDEENQNECLRQIKTVAQELDAYTQKLNKTYSELQFNVKDKNREVILPE